MFKLKESFKTFTALSVLAFSIGAYGDDTEVFYSVNVSKPNLLFVLDVSGSMNGVLKGSGSTIPVNQPVSHVDADSRQTLDSSLNIGPNILNENNIDIGPNNISRFRFNNLGIPEDSVITNAYIQFEAGWVKDNEKNNADAKYYIYTQNTSDAPVVQNGGFNVIGTVEWVPSGGWVQGERGKDQQTPDISGLIQSIVNKNKWNDGNKGLAVYISGVKIQNPSETQKPGKRYVTALDIVGNNTDQRYAPVLHVEYTEDDKSKLNVMKESLRAVLENAPDNVKVGLMNYGQEGDSSSGSWQKRHFAVSGVAFPVTDINAKARDVITSSSEVYGLPGYPNETATIRDFLPDVADSWNASNYTPIVDSLYEAALYMRGEKMHYGQTLPNKNGAHPSTYDGAVITTDMEVDGRDLSTAPTYKTPIESSCQENYIVLMTDGAPTYNIAYDGLGINDTPGPLARRASIPASGQGPQGALANAIPACSAPAGVGNAGKCGAELTNYLATHDNLPDPTGSFPDGQEGDQFIHTFTIGFGTGEGSKTETYLKSLATYDDDDTPEGPEDDGYFEASTPEALADAFESILQEVAAPKGTLASPGYSVNVKSGLEHEKDIYIPVFDRKNSSRWAGNLKKFKIVDDGGRRKIKGSNGVNAVDELGGFTSNALDYWSTSPASDPDGKVVQKGGLANLIDPVGRKVYSDLSSSGNLYAASNLVDESNMSNIDNNALGLPSTATLDYRKEIVNFMRGWKNGIAGGDPRYHMGDMLHSEPLVVTYNKGSDSGAGKEQYIFAGTNEGYLHAFDTDTGEEKFAFIPSELLSTIAEHQFLNTGTQEDHKYGVDGTLTYWFKGGDDGVVNSGDQIILYFGLRRGGTTYYALDVTDIDQPKLLWKKSATNYPSMGQSWSAPYLAKVGIGDDGEGKEVVIISGGYDPDDDRNKPGTLEVDNATSPVTADVGNDILILDAKTGDKIWSLSSGQRSQITNSIPGGVRILDTNYNHKIDRMYFADTGGNVWRLDLSENLGSSGATTELTKFAVLGASRKFYNEPDIALMRLNGKTVFAVSIGSGFRAHPLDKTISDKFFILVDESPFKGLDTTSENAFVPISLGALATINISDSGVSQGGSIKDADKRGWKVNLPEQGEKVLATAVTFDGVVTFTTLVPEVLSRGVGVDQCAAPATQGRFYAINVLTGGAGLDLDLSGSGSDDPFDSSHITDSDIFVTVAKGEIPGKPQTIFNPLDVVGGECTHPVDIRIGKKLSQATGYDACRLESVYWSNPVQEN